MWALRNETNFKQILSTHTNVFRGSLAAGLTVARTEFVGMLFAAGRPILAVILIHQPVTHSQRTRFRGGVGDSLGKHPRLIDRGYLAEPDRDHRNGRRQRPSSRTSTKWPAIAAAAAIAGDTRCVRPLKP